MWTWLILGIVGIIGVLLALRWLRQTESEEERAMQQFRLQRETLEARFFDLAAAAGKPRGLIWTKCEWKKEVRFARDVSEGLLTAFAEVEIYFEAIPGGEMEGVEAVSHFREASAVFHYRSGVWGTGGKALFNMSPAAAVQRLAGQYEPVKADF